MSDELNKYLRDKIIASKDMFLHEAHSIEATDAAAYVVSHSKHRIDSVIISTKGVERAVNGDMVKAKALIDERFEKALSFLKEGLKNKGLA